MNAQISLNNPLYNMPPVKMWLPAEIRSRFSAFAKKVLSRNDLIASAQTEIDTWCASTRVVLDEIFGVPEAMHTKVYTLPCFSPAMLYPENYPNVEERTVMAETGYTFYLPSERFSRLITKSKDDLVEPMIATFVDSNDGFLRGFRWATMNLFWCPSTRKVLSSISFFWNMDDYLVHSEVSVLVDHMEPREHVWDTAVLRSTLSALSRARLAKQDVLRAIDSLDVLARYEHCDKKVETALRRHVTDILEQKEAMEVISWLETTDFPMVATDVALLYDILNLSHGDRDVLSELVTSRDAGEISRNETIYLPPNFLSIHRTTVESRSILAFWTDRELYVLDGCEPENFWQELIPEREEVDLRGVREFVEGLCPAIRILDTDSNTWDQLVVLAQEFTQRLRAKSV